MQDTRVVSDTAFDFRRSRIVLSLHLSSHNPETYLETYIVKRGPTYSYSDNIPSEYIRIYWDIITSPPRPVFRPQCVRHRRSSDTRGQRPTSTRLGTNVTLCMRSQRSEVGMRSLRHVRAVSGRTGPGKPWLAEMEFGLVRPDTSCALTMMNRSSTIVSRLTLSGVYASLDGI